MYHWKSHTRQYTDAEPLRPPRANRFRVTRQHTIRGIATMATVGLAGSSSAIAHADNNHEQEACALMRDAATAMHLGYSESTVQYALAVLSTEMPQVDAAHVLLAATRDYCPDHAADLPAGWL